MLLPDWNHSDIVKALETPNEAIRVILDTDTYNEVDDQYALAYSLLSNDAFHLEAVYAAPFHNQRSNGAEDGMLKSYNEIHRVLDLMKMERDVLKGSPAFFAKKNEPVDSDAAEDLIARAASLDEGEKICVLAIGAITNISSAILMDPNLISKLIVVWLGGQQRSWHSARDFNLEQDLYAAQVLFDSGVPLVLIPTLGVIELLSISIPEIDAYLQGKNRVCDYLADITRKYKPDDVSQEGWTKVIWDIAAPAWLIDRNWFQYKLTDSPVLTDNYTWSVRKNSHPIYEVFHLNRNALFADVFMKLSRFK